VRAAGYALLKMKEKIEQQVKEKTKMLAGVSHDLKTPLTRFKLELELMKKDNHTSEMKKDILQMEKTINDYLDFARGEDLISTKLINLNALLNALLNKAKTNKVKITFIEQNTAYANIKENQFKRAISNFIDNAKRFSSSILVKLYEDKSHIITEIHDNGPGISNTQMDKVLEPFYRVDNARNQDFGGVGLGMSISSDIITKHQGSIALSKSNMGGLLVTIKLPK